MRENAEYVVKSNDEFRPTKRARQSDCYRDEAEAYVLEYCHTSDSRVDTNSYLVYKIRHPRTKEVIRACEQRILNQHGRINMTDS